MFDKVRITRVSRGNLLVLVAGCVLSFAVAAETSIEEDLNRCGKLEDQAARLSCYDEIVDRKPESEPPTPAVAEEATEAEPPAPVVVETDAEAERASGQTATANAEDVAASQSENDERLATLGEEQIGERKSESEKLELTARVVGCKKDDFRRYYFYFENGQVWKQKSERRLTYKECDFNITITRDFFGYKMLPEGETRRIRIARVK